MQCSFLNKNEEAFMQDLVRMCNFIGPGLVIDLKKVYNINGHTAMNAREPYEQIRLIQIVGKVRYVGRR